MMGANPVVLGVVAVVVLAQVPLVAYLSRHVGLDQDAERPDASKGYVTYGTVDARPASNDADGAVGAGASAVADGAVACRACGGVVDDGYAFCGTCATRVQSENSKRGESR
ncbi:hypothetical protein [Halorubellus sp. PRR65]|uniref:hypothetical protein n=1 Tax=Halorubellus sp. PRR65 TaxID=3098148 RepID=UPI002B262E01|nr:hypothetical protein [Halorubellus sp. PRR65]